MTLNHISMKMLIANFRRYRLFFLCNVFSVAIFYSFAAIFTNKSFMDERIVDSMISGNIYAPSLFAGIFLVLFVPYSYHSFLRNRRYEYGVFMTLGMSESEVLANMLLENCIIAAVSLITGLVLGTAVSFAFYAFIQNAIGVSGLRWYFNTDSYQWSAALYGAAMLVALEAGILSFVKMQLIDLVKEKFRAEKKGKALLGLFVAGVALVAASAISMFIGYGTPDIRFILSLAMMFTGLWLTATHVESVKRHFGKILPRHMKHHIPGNSLFRQHDRSRKRVGIIAAGLIGFSIFFAGLCAVLYPGLTENAIRYSPYDLVYSRIFGMNQTTDSEIVSLLNQNHVTVKTVRQAEYLRGMSFNLLPVSEANDEFGCDYQLSEGKFMTVFQVISNDGNNHGLLSPATVQFNCGDAKLELLNAGSDMRILFNKNPTFADMTLVLNDADYTKVASECHDYWTGTIMLYTFDNWKDSAKGIDAVQKFLLIKNQVAQSEQQRYFKASSRIETYKTAVQSAGFLIFLMFFIVVLFCGASDVMIHFKIEAESEEEHRMLSGLHRVGVTADEMLGLIRHKNIHYYMPQVFIGLLIGIFYCYAANEIYGYGWMAAGYGLLVGLVLAALQFVWVRRYSRRELLRFDS